MLVTGGPTVAGNLDYTDIEASFLDDVLGVWADDLVDGTTTKYCGSQASGCEWADGGTPGKTGSPPGTCKDKEKCGSTGVGKGGRECKCCKYYKDAEGKTKDCPRPGGSAEAF